MKTDTIAAISTPPGRGGIGIIRISGTKAADIAGAVFKRAGTANFNIKQPQSELLISHKIYFGKIVEASTQSIIDEVILFYMAGPRSYTREDVVEIQSHSGPVVIELILEQVLKKGARLAEPGEFTKRAFLNGRIDLTQAEAVMELINAKTTKAHEIATRQLNGNIQQQIKQIRKKMVGILASIEADLEFSDEGDVVADSLKMIKSVKNEIRRPLRELAKAHQNNRIFRDGVYLAIIGKPNVGKSSLLNCLVKKERAIVTPIAGTTRDYIEEWIEIQGIPFILCDSAGLREPCDVLETIGVEKTNEVIEKSQLILFVIDANQSFSKTDLDIYKRICKKKIIIVANKIDLMDSDGLFCRLPSAIDQKTPLTQTSATKHIGINKLKEKIITACNAGDMSQNLPACVPNLRQNLLIEESLRAVEDGIGILESKIGTELLAIPFNGAIKSLEQITGDGSPEDLLDSVFKTFCVGK